MKELTLDIVREAFKKQYHGCDDEEADKFMDLIKNIRELADGQTLLRADQLKKEHCGKLFSLLGYPILGTLDDVPPTPTPRKDRKDDEDDIFENLRGYRHGNGYFIVIDGKFNHLSPRALVVITEPVTDGYIKR